MRYMPSEWMYHTMYLKEVFKYENNELDTNYHFSPLGTHHIQQMDQTWSLDYFSSDRLRKFWFVVLKYQFELPDPCTHLIGSFLTSHSLFMKNQWPQQKSNKIVVLPVTVHVLRFCNVTCYIIHRSPTNYVNYDHSNGR